MNQFMRKINMAIISLFLFSLLSCDNNSDSYNSDNENSFTNPLLPSGADPWVFYDNGYYYYTHTLQNRIGIWKTKDISDLKNAASKTVFTPPSGTSYSNALWAPEIFKINDKWYIYFAADDGNHNNHRIFVLENSSSDPLEGEFVMKGKIQTDMNDNWAIDGSVFESKGVYYFIWSGWQETPFVEKEIQRIYIAKMKNPWTLETERIELSAPEYDWEKNWTSTKYMPNHTIYVNEGPEVLKRNKKLHLIYSASGCWTPNYGLGMLTANEDSDLLNPESWKKHDKPVFSFSAENKVFAPGHCCFFKSPDGTEDWILYHANDEPDQGCGEFRSPRAQIIKWNKDDTPDFGIPESTSVKIQKPSGI